MRQPLEVVIGPLLPTNEQTNNLAIATQAADNLVRVKKRRLSKDELAYLLMMISEGCSNRTIIRRMSHKFDREISLPTIVRYKERYTDKIAQYAQDFDFAAINEGFSRRAVRIDRLSKVAELIEDAILGESDDTGSHLSIKLVKEFRELMRQIAQEVGDMPIGGPDMTFINMSDDELKHFVANKLKANKDLSVILSEVAGTRPQPVELIDQDGEVIGDDDGSGYKPRTNGA